jgi:rhodanese-related sulfurtransferase
MKRILILSALMLLLCSCGAEEKQTSTDNGLGYQVIDCAKKDELMEDKAILIDVRTVQEYSEGHLDNSVNISVESINTMIETMVKDKNTPIIVYCRSGNRSATAAQTLVNLGYKKVYDLGAMNNCSK